MTVLNPPHHQLIQSVLCFSMKILSETVSVTKIFNNIRCSPLICQAIHFITEVYQGWLVMTSPW